MKLRLKDNYIVQMSPCKTMLIDVEDDTHIEISRLEGLILGQLDGTGSKETLVEWDVEQGEILPCAFFSRSFLIGTIDDELEEIFTEEKFYRMVSHLKLWADLLKQKNDSITEICEVLKLVEAME